MISEEKVKIMTEMARYEKHYGEDDFRINRYTEKDYIRLETIKMSVALTLAFFGIIAIACIMQMDVLITFLREGKLIVPLVGTLILYAVIFLLYLNFTRKKAADNYKKVEARIKIYNKNLDCLMKLYEEKENEDISPTIAPEEEKDGQIINI